MGDKRRKKKRRSGVFSFAPTKTSKELAAYVTHLLRQNKMCDDSEHDSGNNHRRTMRNALNNQDVFKVKSLLKQGISINQAINEAFGDTPLIYAVKHTYLEIVEALIEAPGCDIDCRGRDQLTALDEAIKAWLLGGGIMETKQHRGRRFRVLRSLLVAGAAKLSTTYIDGIIYSCHNTKNGLLAIEKLVLVVCQKGKSNIKSVLFSVLVSHSKMAPHLQRLLVNGADPSCLSCSALSCHNIPEDNAIIVIKATNHFKIHQLVERYMNIPRNITGDHRSAPRVMVIGLVRSSTHFKHTESVRLLLQAGYILSLQTMNYLHKHQAGLYKMAVGNMLQPRPLRDIARVAVRKCCAPNVIFALYDLNIIPDSIKPFLFFEEHI